MLNSAMNNSAKNQIAQNMRNPDAEAVGVRTKLAEAITHTLGDSVSNAIYLRIRMEDLRARLFGGETEECADEATPLPGCFEAAVHQKMEALARVLISMNRLMDHLDKVA